MLNVPLSKGIFSAITLGEQIFLEGGLFVCLFILLF